ncbi:FKBP-type peptidyl-prolyl cis-trans isomerase FkpA [Buttiauxella sp. BIGb0471]|uniref:FKBP-type peptidyl-prolyl cis-trans isomerase N-terminal domain-containing protein n=1 Tax=Buttiauxella sp. BIGb0471 TaxID=2940597 RepID=UPI002168AFA7|nr:FKBP-type peptidyl-prolyl cis-trans isomerase N-terminal domain-containing protein [Buttiauxella sp. BIGb0471]MCS3601925.1 FKBP-type peptidyl-prolyl cis-trans isomerase FkpA [Buttiauxella sp. BIGb0471]
MDVPAKPEVADAKPEDTTKITPPAATVPPANEANAAVPEENKNSAPESTSLPVIPAETVSEETPTEAAKESAPVFKLDSEEQKRAYASGVGMAKNIEDQIAAQKLLHITLDKDILVAGMMDAFNHQQKMSDNDVHNTLSVFDEQIKVLTAAQNDKRLATSNTYIANFSQREGAKKSQKGFYYIVESKGEGSNITDDSTVAIRFKGTLIDGTVVDEPSVQNANQIFRVKNMMPALRDTVKLLHAGGKIQVLIPPSLVEGTVRLEHPVPVNSLLIYSMEVVDVND